MHHRNQGSHRPTVKPLEIGGGSLKRNYSFFLPIAGRSAVVGGTMHRSVFYLPFTKLWKISPSKKRCRWPGSCGTRRRDTSLIEPSQPGNKHQEHERTMTRATLDFDRLLKLRLVVARFGEMDLAKWWNTRGQLGRLGTAAIRRGFPRTHYFAQARSVFAVAAHRCREIFDPPDSVTLWRLPETIDAFG